MTLKFPAPAAVSFPTVSFQLCPAKTWHGNRGEKGLLPTQDEVRAGRNVFEHCAIVCAVAQEIIGRMPKQVQRLFPAGSAFAAGCHDIGKVSPFFYEKIRRACAKGVDGLLELPGIDPRLESAWGGHAGVSQLCAQHLKAPRWVPEVLGNHHGSSPRLGGRTALDEQMGGPGWQRERERLVQALSEQTGLTWPSLESANQARLVSGLATVSDWIGSGQHFEDPALPWSDRVGEAVSAAGFVPPVYRPSLSFRDIFGFEPRAAQSALFDSVLGPGTYLFEAPMGLGKTEAALYAAYRLLQSGQASGVYFALPTQLTSNKIQERFEPFLDRILVPGCSHRSWLLHAASWMLEAEQGEDARPGASWFSQAKRGLLAPFAVGTIDQALMAAMRVKHGFVRAFGLAGKVVVLDEVHTYDAYTGTLLQHLVRTLRDLGCTIIVLSATLDGERRQALLPTSRPSMAYPLITAHPTGSDAAAAETAVEVEPGACREVSVQLESDDSAAVDEVLARAHAGQQVLWIENTVAQAQARFQQLAARAGSVECGLLHARFTPADRARAEDRWVRLFGKDGWEDRGVCGRILIGTQVLEQSLDLDADFLVSAFAPTDMLLQRMGRLWRHAGTPRPGGLDSPEAWFLAPTLAAALEDPRKVFGPSAQVYAPYVLCRSLEVWESLCQKCEQNKCTVQNKRPVKSERSHTKTSVPEGKQKLKVVLPDSIRSLVEETYAPQEGPDARLARWQRELEEGRPPFVRGRKALAGLAAQALSDYGNVDSDDDWGTRIGDRPTTSWLLVADLLDLGDGITRLTFLDGQRADIPHARAALDKAQWRQLAIAVARHTVTVPARSDGSPATVGQLKQCGLHHVCYVGPPDAPAHTPSRVQVGLVKADGDVHPAFAPPQPPGGRYGALLGYQYIPRSSS